MKPNLILRLKMNIKLPDLKNIVKMMIQLLSWQQRILKTK